MVKHSKPINKYRPTVVKTFKIRSYLAEALKNRAEKEGVTESEIVRRALIEYLLSGKMKKLALMIKDEAIKNNVTEFEMIYRVLIDKLSLESSNGFKVKRVVL